MRKLSWTIILVAAFSVSCGCANGPLRQFFKGAPCSSCNPPFGLFNRNSNTAGTCSTGNCGGVAPIDGTMAGGENFGNGYYNNNQLIGNPGEQQPTPGAIPNTGATDSYPYPANKPVIGAGFDGYVNPPTNNFPSNQ